MKKKIAIILSVLSFAICGCNSEEASWEGTYKCSYSVTNSGGFWDLYNYTLVIDEKDEQLNIYYEERVNGGGMATIDIEEAIIQNTGTHLKSSDVKNVTGNDSFMEIELLDDGKIKVRTALDEESLSESEFVTLERTDE